MWRDVGMGMWCDVMCVNGRIVSGRRPLAHSLEHTHTHNTHIHNTHRQVTYLLQGIRRARRGQAFPILAHHMGRDGKRREEGRVGQQDGVVGLLCVSNVCVRVCG